MPFVADPGKAATDLVGEMLTKLARPLSDGFVGDDDTAGRQQLLNHAKPERETEIQPNGMADDLGREPIPGIAGASRCPHPTRLLALICRRKRMPPQVDGAAVAYRMQELTLGGPRPQTQRRLRQIVQEFKKTGATRVRTGPELKPGTRLLREWQGRTYEVLVLDDGFSWQGKHYRSLSAIARKITGTAWSGPLFFGLKTNRSARPLASHVCSDLPSRRKAAMPRASLSHKRCAIYTRKSSEEGLEQEFNSLAAQRDACEAYIRSQQHEGWVLARDPITTMAGSRAAAWSGRRCNTCLPTSDPAASTSSSSTRSTG